MRMGKNESSRTTMAANRSEDLRRKRTQRSQKRINTVSSRIVNPVNPRPVIVRGNAFGTPIHRQAGTRARRQFYLTMDQTAGSELRLPAFPLINPGWRLASGLLMILAAIGIFSLWNSPYFQVSSVEVNGLERLSAEEVNKTLNLANTSIVEVDAKAVHDKLMAAYPELIDAQVQVEMPNFVTVTARERKPVMAVKKGDQVSWIDTDGVIFPAHGDAGSLLTINTDDDLPTVAQVDPAQMATLIADSGNSDTAATQAASVNSTNQAGGASASANGQAANPTGPRKVDPELVAAAQQLSQKLPAGTQIIYSKQNGLGWTDPGGWNVYIGKDLTDFDQKYAMYQKIASYLSEQGLKPVLISVEQLNAPYYRLEQ